MVRLRARALLPLHSVRLQQGDPSMGNQEVLVVSPQALENYQEAFRALIVAYHDTWWLLVRAEDQACGERLALARAARLAAHTASGGHLTRSMHRGPKSSTPSRVTTNSGQHGSGTQLGTFWPGVRSVFCRSSASQPSRGSRMPMTMVLRSLIVIGCLLLRHPQLAAPLTLTSSRMAPIAPTTMGSRFAGNGRVHATSAATRARVICRTFASAVSLTGWRLAQCSRSAKPIVLQRTKSGGCDILVAVRECHTLPSRLRIFSSLRSSDTTTPCRSQRKGQRPLHSVTLPGNAIAVRLASVGLISATETLTTRWDSLLTHQTMCFLKPLTILWTGSLLPY